ncbi:MAG: lipoyl(octanoyl) transferase LipB [Pseudomonadota bacterium]
MSSPLHLRRLGRRPYEPIWRAMRDFTEGREATTPDECWLVEHPPTYTLGRNADRSHLLDPGVTAVVAIDRGGQVTYHGPGQVVLYTLVDLRRRGLGVRALVDALEEAVRDLLAAHGLAGTTRRDAPGVYVGDAKIAALGLRIRHGRAYHGLALNVAMDLAPFDRINPCGYRDLAVTDLARLGGPAETGAVGDELARAFAARLGAPLLTTEPGESPHVAGR